MTALLKVGDTAVDASLLDRAGNTFQLSDLWQDGPTLLTFLRHFG
jgi:peroxiredoxin